MYAYKHDPETGGLLLTDVLSGNSKEPRPVYSRELDILRFDEFWNYERQDDAPYLWAEANFYWYRGVRVAHTTGGSLYERPTIVLEKDEQGNTLLPTGTVLKKVDIPRMAVKNRDMLAVIEKTTIKKIYDVYQRYKNKLDCFHVAFSGGKDSIVLLELVKRALPKTAFLVIFGDTGMEFPDTYDAVDKVEEQCRKEGIAFYRAASHLKPEESWKLFGPPSRVLRWCCTVHKAVPQTLKIREILGKDDYTGMDFVGVRASESVTRSEYEYENFGKKQKGQYSFNPILEWNSAEIWTCIYYEECIINHAYKKGNQRVGCLFCPHSGGKADYIRYVCYPEQISIFTNIIANTINDKNVISYIQNGGWIERKNGRDLKNNPMKYTEITHGNDLFITIENPTTDWLEWSKTLGDIPFTYSVLQEGTTIQITFKDASISHPKLKLLKQVLHKASYCVKCRACEMNCKHGAINFNEGFSIDNCLHCGQCHQIDDGCLAFHSLQQPRNGGFLMKSLNTFADHAPKKEWITSFFNDGNAFLKNHSLGPMQISMFRRFLNDGGLIQKGLTTPFYDLIKRIGSTSEDAWALIMVQEVCNNPQVMWYIRNLPVEELVPPQIIISKLVSLSVSEKDAHSIVKAFKRLCDIPLGTRLHFGKYVEEKKKIIAIGRTKTTLSDARVILYSLYKFAEACERYYEFSLSRLMDFTVESAGVSPAEIFGLDRGEMEAFLHRLARSYPDYISFTTTHDLENIRLSDDKTSEDVLTLFD